MHTLNIWSVYNIHTWILWLSSKIYDIVGVVQRGHIFKHIIYAQLIEIGLHVCTKFWCGRGRWYAGSSVGEDIFKLIACFIL